MSTKSFKKEFHITRFKIMWPFLRLISTKKIRDYYDTFDIKKSPEIKSPFLMLSNHSAIIDSFVIGNSVKPMFFTLMSESLYRQSDAAKYLSSLFPLIVKKRVVSDFPAVRRIMTLLKNGQNVLIFPEGRVTQDGATCAFDDSLLRLAKKSGVQLVTYKIKGGHLAKPMWGTLRKGGHIEAGVVNVYSPEQVASMSLEELYSCVREDLYENAFETQKIFRTEFSSPNLAQGIENIYCICPKCHFKDTLYTESHTVFCRKCGPLVKFSRYGTFDEPKDFFANTIEWYKWQDSYIRDLCLNTPPDTVIEQDDLFEVRLVNDDHTATTVAKGPLKIYSNRLELGTDTGTVTYSFDDIQAAVYLVRSSAVVEFSTRDNSFYELHALGQSHKSTCVLLAGLIQSYIQNQKELINE